MYKCPHCGKEIQNEAILCRYCRRDVEKPLWLENLRKCPFCAEWIEQDLDKCPICGKDQSSRFSPMIPPFTQQSRVDLISELRQPVSIPPRRPQPPPSTPLPEKPKETTRAPSSISLSPVEDGVPSLRNSLFDEPGGMSGLGGIKTSQVEKGKFKLDLANLFPPSLRRALLILFGIAIVIGIVVLVMGPGRDFINQLRTSSPIKTPQPSPSPTTIIVTTTATLIDPTETLTVVPSPTTTSTCVLWDQISLEDEGNVLCVYGKLRRWFSTGDIPFVAIFSEDLGTFTFLDYTTTYAEAKPGVCIMAEGVIEIMRGSRPFIDLAGTLEFCPDELEENP